MFDASINEASDLARHTAAPKVLQTMHVAGAAASTQPVTGWHFGYEQWWTTQSRLRQISSNTEM